MRNMITHHQQAVEMSELVPSRTNNEAIIKIADRILASQKDEITFMRDWLKQAGEEASAPTGGHQGHGSHANHELMRGMATSEQLAELAAANGTAFDRQFLSLMMEHRSEEHTSELQSLMRISYAVFCLKKKTYNKHTHSM